MSTAAAQDDGQLSEFAEQVLAVLFELGHDAKTPIRESSVVERLPNGAVGLHDALVELRGFGQSGLIIVNTNVMDHDTGANITLIQLLPEGVVRGEQAHWKRNPVQREATKYEYTVVEGLEINGHIKHGWDAVSVFRDGGTLRILMRRYWDNGAPPPTNVEKFTNPPTSSG